MRHPHALMAVSGFVLLSLLAGCQTAFFPDAGGASRLSGPPLSSQAGRQIAERKGWRVETVANTPAQPAHCQVMRSGDDGATLIMQAAPGLFAVLIGTQNQTLTPGNAYNLTFTFQKAPSQSHQAQAIDPTTLAIRIGGLDYEDATEALAHTTRLEVSSASLGGRIAAFPMTGSSWAVNALDECRRIHTQG